VLWQTEGVAFCSSAISLAHKLRVFAFDFRKIAIGGFGATGL
jgi:hypothetical protein